MKSIPNGHLYDTPGETAKTARRHEDNREINAKSDFRIDRDGTWFYHGSPILRKSLVKLFSTVLTRETDGSFWLVTPVERVEVTVDDAPFVVVAATQAGSGKHQCLHFQTNLGDMIEAGPEHPIWVIVNPENGQPTPYVKIRSGIEALIARTVFYDLVAWAKEDVSMGELFIQSNNMRFSLGRFTEENNPP